MRCLIAFLVFLTLVSTVSAIQTDTISITMPPDSRECFDILLPDNLGVIPAGRYEYNIVVYPDPSNSWLDLSEITIRPDENEAVLLPVCFFSMNQPIGNCSEPFELTIRAIGPTQIPEKRITGKACVGANQDVDTDKGSGPDIFDMALEKSLLYVKPGAKANYVVMIQSQAGVTVDMEVLSQGQSIINKTSQFGQERFSNATFMLTAATKGEYKFTVVGKVRGCSDKVCTKTLGGTLVVTDNPPEERGFTVSLFPKNIDVKDRDPVSFKATIENNLGAAKTFTLSLNLPEGLESDFSQDSVDVSDGSKEVVEFTVTPEIGSELFTLSVNASVDGSTKEAVSYMSTDEMLTDVQNQADNVGTTDAEDAMDEYVRRYMESDFNESLEGYEETAIALDEMAVQDDTDGTEEIDDYDPTETEEPDEEGIPIWIFIIIAGAGLAGSLAFMKLRKGKQDLDKEFKL